MANLVDAPSVTFFDLFDTTWFGLGPWLWSILQLLSVIPVFIMICLVHHALSKATNACLSHQQFIGWLGSLHLEKQKADEQKHLISEPRVISQGVKSNFILMVTWWCQHQIFGQSLLYETMTHRRQIVYLNKKAIRMMGP